MSSDVRRNTFILLFAFCLFLFCDEGPKFGKKDMQQVQGGEAPGEDIRDLHEPEAQAEARIMEMQNVNTKMKNEGVPPQRDSTTFNFDF